MFVVINADVEGTLPGDPDLLGDVIARFEQVRRVLMRHHEQVNLEAQWPLRGLSGSVGDSSADISLPDR